MKSLVFKREQNSARVYSFDDRNRQTWVEISVQEGSLVLTTDEPEPEQTGGGECQKQRHNGDG